MRLNSAHFLTIPQQEYAGALMLDQHATASVFTHVINALFTSSSSPEKSPVASRGPIQGSFGYKMGAHSEILFSKCAQFREPGEFIDVRLKVGESEFAAHRIVLAANSDYFHAMLARGMKESNQEVIELKDENISVAAMKLIIDSIYSGKIHLNDESLLEVLTAADHL